MYSMREPTAPELACFLYVRKCTRARKANTRSLHSSSERRTPSTGERKIEQSTLAVRQRVCERIPQRFASDSTAAALRKVA